MTIEVVNPPEVQLPPHPHHTPPHEIPMYKGTNINIFPPSRIFINFLLLTITYFLSTFLESYVYIKRKKN